RRVLLYRLQLERRARLDHQEPGRNQGTIGQLLAQLAGDELVSALVFEWNKEDLTQLLMGKVYPCGAWNKEDQAWLKQEKEWLEGHGLSPAQILLRCPASIPVSTRSWL